MKSALPAQKNNLLSYFNKKPTVNTAVSTAVATADPIQSLARAPTLAASTNSCSGSQVNAESATTESKGGKGAIRNRSSISSSNISNCKGGNSKKSNRSTRINEVDEKSKLGRLSDGENNENIVANIGKSIRTSAANKMEIDEERAREVASFGDSLLSFACSADDQSQGEDESYRTLTQVAPRSKGIQGGAVSRSKRMKVDSKKSDTYNGDSKDRIKEVDRVINIPSASGILVSSSSKTSIDVVDNYGSIGNNANVDTIVPVKVIADEIVKHDMMAETETFTRESGVDVDEKVVDIVSREDNHRDSFQYDAKAGTSNGDTDTNDLSESGNGGDAINLESIRLDNIRRNQDFMLSLGLGGSGMAGGHVMHMLGSDEAGSSSASSKRKRTSSSSSSRARVAIPDVAPTRRSSRVSGLGVVRYSDDLYSDSFSASSYVSSSDKQGHEGDDADDMPDVDVDLYDSGLSKYVISTSNSKSISNSSSNNNNNSSSGEFTLLSDEPIVNEDGPSAIYSMVFHPTYRNLLACGGKSGLVSLYFLENRNKNENKDEGGIGLQETLISFQAHGRWISAVKFVDVEPSNASNSNSNSDFPNNSYPNSRPTYLLTSADDGLVKLWDLSKRSQTKPRLVLSTKDIHFGKGVFTLDYYRGMGGGGAVLTGSKDKTVVYSQLSDTFGELTPVKRYEELHNGVVKTVCWRGGPVFASGSQDRSVCVKDVRSSSSAPDICLEEVQAGGVYSVSWAPSLGDIDFESTTGGNSSGGSGNSSSDCSDSNFLLVAGASPVIKMFDIRRPDPSIPLCTFQGHCPLSVRKLTTIHPPKFVSPYKLLATASDSNTLSLYSFQEIVEKADRIHNSKPTAATTTAEEASSSAVVRPLAQGEMPDQPMTLAPFDSSSDARGPHRVMVACRQDAAIYPVLLR